MGKSTISMAIFNGKLLVHQRVYGNVDPVWPTIQIFSDFIVIQVIQVSERKGLKMWQLIFWGQALQIEAKSMAEWFVQICWSPSSSNDFTPSARQSRRSFCPWSLLRHVDLQHDRNTRGIFMSIYGPWNIFHSSVGCFQECIRRNSAWDAGSKVLPWNASQPGMDIWDGVNAPALLKSFSDD